MSFRSNRSNKEKVASKDRKRAQSSTPSKNGHCQPRQSSIEEYPNNDQLQRILENLVIRFTNCTFTYKSSHLEEGNLTRNHSSRKSLSKKILATIDKALDVGPEHNFEKCLFIPTDEKDVVKAFINDKYPNFKISFINCKFKKRSSTLTEKIKRNLRKMFGIVYELHYVTATANIDGYNFRLKDFPTIYQYVQSRSTDDE